MCQNHISQVEKNAKIRQICKKYCKLHDNDYIQIISSQTKQATVGVCVTALPPTLPFGILKAETVLNKKCFMKLP
jgi:hypothetical protein